MLAKLINLKNWKAKRRSRVHPSDRKIKSPGKITEALFYGNVHYPHGAKYVGEWIFGKYKEFHGLGMFIYASGGKYVGEWKNHKHHGKGIHTYNSGSKYVGEWKNHKRHGFGIYFCLDGSRLAGKWVDDVFVGVDQENIN